MEKPDIRRQVGAFMRYLRKYAGIKVTSGEIAYSAAEPEHPEREKAISITIKYKQQ